MRAGDGQSISSALSEKRRVTKGPTPRRALMRASPVSVLGCLLLGAAGPATAQDEDVTRSLTMTCEYADYGSWQHEAVVIVDTATIFSRTRLSCASAAFPRTPPAIAGLPG
jgi:hypothetical protein